jgi:hypothetical protein
MMMLVQITSGEYQTYLAQRQEITALRAQLHAAEAARAAAVGRAAGLLQIVQREYDFHTMSLQAYWDKYGEQDAGIERSQRVKMLRAALAAAPAPTPGGAAGVTQADVREFIITKLGPEELTVESGIGEKKITEEHNELMAAVEAWRAGNGSIEDIARETADVSLCLKITAVILGFDLNTYEREKLDRNLAATWEKLSDGRWKRVAALAAPIGDGEGA